MREMENILGPGWGGGMAWVLGWSVGGRGSTKRPSKGWLCNERNREARAGGWKTLWEAAAQSASRCWLREDATCTIPKGAGAGGKPRLPEEVGSYATTPHHPTNKHTQHIWVRFRGFCHEGRSPGRGSSCGLSPKATR